MKEKPQLQESHQEKVRMKKIITFTLRCRRCPLPWIPSTQFRPVKQKLGKASLHTRLGQLLEKRIAFILIFTVTNTDIFNHFWIC